MLLVVATFTSANDVVVLLDNSGSMRENDPERLLKTAVIEMIRRFPQDVRISVFRYDSEPTALLGLADRPADLELALASIDYEGQLTDIPAAVERALYELRDHGAHRGLRHIVLITDGIVDLGDVTASRRAEDWLTGALVDSAVREAIQIHAIAFTDGADYRILQGITEATGGSYYRAGDIRELKAVLDRIRVVVGGGLRPGLEPVDVPDIRPIVTIARRFAAPPPALEAPASASPPPPSLRWWVIALVMLAMVGAAAGAVALTMILYRRLTGATAPPAGERPEYFPECYLVDLDGVTPSMRHPLKSQLNIASRLKNPPDDGMNYIYIPRPSIGRSHAMVEYRDRAFWIKDLNSMNGTRVNGKRVTSEQRLKHGDRIKFHTYEFEFSMADLAYSNHPEPDWRSRR